MNNHKTLETLMLIELFILLCFISLKLFNLEKYMDKDSVAFWAMVFTGGTVIVAIVALVVQVRKLNQQLQLQYFTDFIKRYQEIMLKLPEEINYDTFGLSKLKELYEPNYKTIKRSLRTYFDLCYEEWSLNNDDALEPHIWKTWEYGMQTAMSRTIFREFWEQEVVFDTEYGKEFNSFINVLINSEKAKELQAKREEKLQERDKKLLNL